MEKYNNHKTEAHLEIPDVLPQIAKEFAETAASSMNCNLEFLITTILIAASYAIGSKVKIRIKRGWTEGACLYLVLVADPGSKKSPAIKAALKPLEDLQNKSLKPKEEEDGDVRLVRARTTMTTDTTTEALMELLQLNPHGIVIYKDEFIGFIKGMDQYRGGKGDDLEKFLTLWSQAIITVHRKGKIPIQINFPFVSIVGGIQPDVLSLLAKMKDNGFTERLLFCFPKRIALVHTDSEIPDEVAQKYIDLIQGIYHRQSENEFKVVAFTPGAQALWKEWHITYCELMNVSQHKGALTKLEAYTARFALILEFLWRAEDGKPVDEITVGSLERAIKLTDYFAANIQKVYGSFATSQIDKQIEKAVLWFKRQSHGMATMRKFYTNRVAGVKNADEAYDIFMEMRSRNLGRMEEAHDGPSSKRQNFSFCLRSDLMENNTQNPSQNG